MTEAYLPGLKFHLFLKTVHTNIDTGVVFKFMDIQVFKFIDLPCRNDCCVAST